MFHYPIPCCEFCQPIFDVSLLLQFKQTFFFQNCGIFLCKDVWMSLIFLFLPEIFPSTRVVLVGSADEQDVNDQVDRGQDGGGYQVLLALGRVAHARPEPHPERVEHHPHCERHQDKTQFTGFYEKEKRGFCRLFLKLRTKLYIHIHSCVCVWHFVSFHLFFYFLSSSLQH